MDLSRQLRSAALICFISLVLIQSSNSRYHGKRHKRQNGAHMYLPESFIVPNGEGVPSEWSEWSSPSECSRSCGGGVSFQTRECYAPNGDCHGGSRKYFSCNTQDCPEEESDFRAQQCSRFDSVPFDGVRYEWVPYTNAPNPCELNCMPRGERFYYRHKAKVIDGTRCNDKTLDVCVDGECQPVGCDMMLGSTAREDKCRKCAGDGSSCKTISGLFETNNLAAGYNDILLIPVGATNIVLKEVASSNNYLACRNLTGHYYLNGNWRIDFPRPMHFAGAWWHYQRKPTGFAAPDQLTCSGPTTESIYVVMLIQDHNVGVQYEYSIPESVTKNLPDAYSWTHMEYSPCSASCGGGVQSRNVTCNNRLTLEQVDDSLCDANTKPNETQMCATEECAPRWVEGVWQKCSKACGKDGLQQRTVSCERTSSNGMITVLDDKVCLKAIGNKPATEQECNRDVQNCPKFHTGPWSPCDKLCGEGQRSRKVTCFQEQNGRKKVLPDNECTDNKPETVESCMLAPCEGVDWIVSQWSGCGNCGQTKETRTAICGSKSGKKHDAKFCLAEKPQLSRPCLSTKCQTQWFTSQWSECSSKCGKGIQSRIVICGEFNGDKVTPAADDSKCNAAEKPEGEQECESKEAKCPGEWFTGPWGDCSKTCGGGQRSREVLCLANGTKVSTCEESKIEFTSEICNSQPCTDDETIPINSTDKSIEADEDSDEECDEDYDEEDFGVELLPKKRKEDLKLGAGVEFDTASTISSSLIMDDLMLSDSPTTGDKSTTVDSSTELPETTVEGSGEGTDITFGSTNDVSEGSGDGDEEDFTTRILSTEYTVFMEQTTDKSESSSSTSFQLSSESSEISSQAAFTSVTDVSDSSSSKIESTSETTVLSTGTQTTDTSIISTSISDISTVYTDLLSSSYISSASLTESSTVQDLTESTSRSALYSETADYSTPLSSSEPTLVDSTQTSLYSSSETTGSSAAALSSSTVTTSESSTVETTSGDIDISETTYESSTETTLESSTETTLESSTETTSESSTETTSESSTETTSESSTETTLENSTGTTLESSTETELTSESTLEETSETSSKSPSDSSTKTTLDESTIETTSSESSETSPNVATETSIEITTFTTSDITGISHESSTDLTSEQTSQTIDASSEATTSVSLNPTEIVSTSSDLTESSELQSSIETSTDETSFETSETSETKTNELASTVSYSESTTGISTSAKSELTDTTSLTTEESKPSESSSIYTSEGLSDATTESHGLSSDASSTSDLSTSTDSTIVETTTVTGIELSSIDVTTQEITDKSTPLDVTTVDIWSSESTEISDVDISQTTPNTLEAALDREAKPRKCKPKRPKKDSCLLSNFGCCPDKKNQAKGPFGLGCPVIKTCSDSQFGCCPDGLSPSEGKNNKGCPKSMCAETLFGCCQDNYTPAEGEDNEGCPEPTTEPPTTTITPEVEKTEVTTLSTDLTEVTESSSDTTEEYDASDSIDTTETSTKSNLDDEGGCLKSQYGCCRDGKHPALGPNEEGCASCTREPYGCCPDDVTPAHGILGEGCCLSSRFGCCPDNINAARGPNFQDCDCRYTPYGCCPDNTTAARGYNNDGCGCEYSPFGCCPDKLTPSQGHKFAGCPCHTMQFGCCPDGITIPQGPHHYGCHCSQTQYKCCSDEKTPAKGPNFQGCTCAESKFGCCPDGTTDAQGSKFEGCEIIQESPQKSCGLPKETGTCSNFTIKYFFDTSYGACARFWYGGCDGNGNRFETEAECRDTCQEYKGKDTCLLPKSAGPCPGFQKKWYFNSERNRCEEFNYGGCYGTSNRFDSLEECNAQCSVEDSLPPCEQPMDEGPCRGNFERWFYDNETDVCRQFTYGGCKGNKNNYATEDGCNYHCREPGVHKELCALPKENGSCGGNHARWHFSESEQKCLPFYYTGCGGNKNNFQTLESCEEHCPKKIAKDVCEIPAEVGECQNYVPRWYWDTKDERCRQFYYGGCGGNGNNFAEEEECSQRCQQKPETTTTPRSRQSTRQQEDRPTQSPDSAVYPDRVPNLDNAAVQGAEEKCFQPAEAGECEEYIHRWFYNADEGLCDQFIYRGCRGNNNNFGSEEECENSCFHVQSTCSLPPVYGRCNDNTTRWHYDESTKRCYEFEFSGCRGNRNNFFTEQECMDYCQNAHPEEDSPHTESYSNTPDYQCELPLEIGNCRDNILSWYYNRESKQCVGFYYSGCNGNANRFQSKEQCDRQCGLKDVDEISKNNQIDSRSDFIIPSTDRCETFEAQCRSLQCPFGSKSSQGSDGCRRCECINPCANYSCLDEEKCAVDVSSDPSSEVRFVPVCRQISKPGECPQLLNGSMCHRECYDDADCRGDNKCCSEGCSQVCVNPHQPEVQTTSLRPPSPITESILPGESPAALEPKKPEEVEVTSSTGSVAVLRCFATGNPPPIVTWRRGAVLIDTNKGRYVLTSSGDLTIVQVHQSDSGSYICVASNGLGAPVTREVNLQVSETKKNVPAYIYGPKNLTQIVVLKQPAVIRCPAGGNPKPHVNWWRGKNRMALTTPRYDTKRDYSLVFRSVELADLGPYECSAWTGHGKPASMVIVLKAVGPVHASNRNEEMFLKYVINPALIPTTSKPVYSFRPTRPRIVDLGSRFGGEKELVTSPPYRKSVSATAIIRRDSSNNYTIGSDIVLNCEVGGYPAPNVTWLKDNKQILPSNRLQITENPYRLVIYGVAAEDSGYYGCTATNAFSFNTSEEKILIESGVYVRPDCIDNEHFANCALIVKGRYCSNNYYARFCCRSCTLAGQLPGHPNFL